MHCASCASTIEKTLKNAKGVSKASVNFGTESAIVEYDKRISEEEIEKLIEGVGYGIIKEENGVLRLRIIGMDNDHCVNTIKKALDNLKGIKAKGEKFNPEFHEAVEMVESNKESGEITEEIQKGYMLGEKVLRASKVKVNK